MSSVLLGKIIFLVQCISWT